MKFYSHAQNTALKRFVGCNRRGFTLIELLGVLFIIATLIGILYPTLAKVRVKAKMAKAQTDIESIGVALRMYESDLGKYPPNTTTGGGELYKYLWGDPAIRPNGGVHSNALNIDVGPYMEFKAKDLDANKSYMDPWKKPYVYASKDGTPAATHNTSSFDIHSPGPDGSDATSDDINNW